MAEDKEKRNYKKIFTAFVILAVISTVCINSLWLNRFGYFANGPKMNFSHEPEADLLKLNNGNVLILGSNFHKSPYKNRWSINRPVIKEIPCEIYNVKSNKFEVYKLPNSIAYAPYGILLDNNKLLLTFAYNPNDNNIKYTEYATIERKPPYPYDSMAIIDLKTGKIISIIQKKINKQKEPDFRNNSFTLLGNGKVLIIDFQNNLAEIYNPQTNSSKILQTKVDKRWGGKVVAYGKNKALIFGPESLGKSKHRKLKYADRDDILEYDDTNEIIKPVGKSIIREYPLIKKINDKQFLIFGGQIYASDKFYENMREIELYDADKQSSKVVALLQETRKSRINETTLNVELLNNKHLLIYGGEKGSHPFRYPQEKTEILDLDTWRIYRGPNMPNAEYYCKAIKVNNKNILFIYTSRNGNVIKIFKIIKP